MGKFSRSKLANYIADSTKSANEISDEVAALLIESGSTSDLDSIMRDVMEQRAKASGVVELTAHSAHKIDDDAKSQIEAVTKKLYPNVKTIQIHEEHNPDIIGGIRLEYANAVLDLTVQSKLNMLKKSIS